MPIRQHTPRPAPRFMSVHDQFPDTSVDKDVFFGQNRASTHTTIYWLNAGIIRADGSDDEPENRPCIETLHLTGGPGKFAHFQPYVSKQSSSVLVKEYTVKLGTFTFQQRDKIRAMAREVTYDRNSTVNNCRVHTRKLMARLVEEDWLSQHVYDTICREGDLPAEIPDA